MKAIKLEVQDTVYQKIIDFLALLPQDHCHLLVNDNGLSDAELSHKLHKSASK